MENLAKINETQLEEVVKNSGLQIQEGEEIKKSYIPYLNQLAEIQEQSKKINFETPAQIDEMIARDLRLKTVKIRTGAKQLKEDRKRVYLLRGNLEQAAFNLISASCELAENVFTQVEKAREIAAEKAAQELKLVREKELEPYQEFLLPGLDLAHMDEGTYQKVLNGAKLQHQYRIDQQKKEESERIEREKEQERIRIENEKLKEAAEKREKEIQAERDKAEKARKDAEAKAAEEKRKANERLAFERKQAEALAEKERQKAAAILKAEKDKSDKLQAEIKAREARELQAKKELEAKKIADEKARLLAEKKAKAAPDKQKLIAFSQILKGLNFPEMKTDEGVKILMDIQVLMQKLTNFIDEKASQL